MTSAPLMAWESQESGGGEHWKRPGAVWGRSVQLERDFPCKLGFSWAFVEHVTLGTFQEANFQKCPLFSQGAYLRPKGSRPFPALPKGKPLAQGPYVKKPSKGLRSKAFLGLEVSSGRRTQDFYDAAGRNEGKSRRMCFSMFQYVFTGLSVFFLFQKCSFCEAFIKHALL